MAIYPAAKYRPVGWANSITRKKGHTKPEVAVLHIAVSARTTQSLYGYFTGGGKGLVCSHFYVADDGTVEQYIDTAMRSSADYSGGDRTISIETAGGLGADLNKPWSNAQVASIVKLLAWLHKTHGIPVRLMGTSKKTEKGIGYHRLGVPSSAAMKLIGKSLTGGELWSGAVGKTCPGAVRTAQIPNIVSQVKQVVAGKDPTPKPPAPKPPTPKPEPNAAEIKRVKGFQKKLKKMGLYTGLIDGDEGSMTRAATLRYQQDLNTYAHAGLVEDGRWGSVTENWYQWVINAQKSLNAFKSSRAKLRVDGHYGSLTAAYVRDVQRRNGLHPDGMCGPVMIRFMRSHGSKIPNRPPNRP